MPTGTKIIKKYIYFLNICNCGKIVYGNHKCCKGHQFLGKKFTEKHLKNLSITHIGNSGYWTNKKRPLLSEKRKGINNPNWKGGNTYNPYNPKFNFILKEKIRIRDSRICQNCGKTEIENKRRLCIHHIDYNKQNCTGNNLITLCDICHSKTNKNREYWKITF